MRERDRQSERKRQTERERERKRKRERESECERERERERGGGIVYWCIYDNFKADRSWSNKYRVYTCIPNLYCDFRLKHEV